MLDRVGRDALLVVRAQLGDRRALAERVEHWHGPVWRFARRMLNGARSADDASQDAWARALKALPRLREPDGLAPWLLTIVRRAVIDQLAFAVFIVCALGSTVTSACGTPMIRPP